MPQICIHPTEISGPPNLSGRNKNSWCEQENSKIHTASGTYIFNNTIQVINQMLINYWLSNMDAFFSLQNLVMNGMHYKFINDLGQAQIHSYISLT